MTANNDRFDISPYLIHFVRWIKVEEPDDLETCDLDAHFGDVPVLPEDWGWDFDIAERAGYMVFLSPFFLLRTIVRSGRIWATWAKRTGVRTVYGLQPAVCFTEMPLGAFVQSGRARASKKQNMSPLGIVLPKGRMFALGARPVIYGLSGSAHVTSDDEGARLLPERALPLREQYRYVAYNAASNRGPDWTHEREWRWPLKVGATPDSAGPVGDVGDVPGIDLYAAGTNMKGAGAVVQSERQARLLTHDILRLVDQELVPAEALEFILVLDKLPPAEELVDRAAVKLAINASTVQIDGFLVGRPEDDVLTKEFRRASREIARAASQAEYGECGGCWLWLLDNTHPLSRALLRAGEIVISRTGRYLVRLPTFGDRALRQREEMTRSLAKWVNTKFDLPCTYFSVLGSEDPNAVPFYCDDVDDRGIFYNRAWCDEDLAPSKRPKKATDG